MIDSEISSPWLARISGFLGDARFKYEGVSMPAAGKRVTYFTRGRGPRGTKAIPGVSNAARPPLIIFNPGRSDPLQKMIGPPRD